MSAYVDRSGTIKLVFIALLYYSLSIGLTFYQKWFIKAYKLPLLVVCGHYLIKYVAAFICRFTYEVLYTKRLRVSLSQQLRWLIPIGVCASLDIGLSNWALEYVTVSLYTMAKCSSIIFIVGFSLILRLERWRPSLGLETGFIAFGLVLFTWKSSQMDLTGLMLVELATACTGIRWTVSQLVMQREEKAIRHPLDMIVHVQPWMMIPIVPMIIIFEGPEMSWDTVFSFEEVYDPAFVMVLVGIGGVLAFCMEFSEYLLLVNTSGITLNIFGIAKEIATLLLAHYVNHDTFSSLNTMGLCLCFAGMILHGMNKRRPRIPIKSAESSFNDDAEKLLMEDADD